MTDVLVAHGFYLKNDRKQRRRMFPYPPLGTLYAAAYLRSRGFEVAFFDSLLAEEEEFEAVLDRHRPAVVVLYEDTFNFLTKMCLLHARQATCRMSQAAKDRGAWVLAASADVSDHADVYFESGVDYALVGEADHTLVELVEVLLERSAGRAEEIPGLVLPGGLRTPARPVERQPDSFPFPAWDLLDAERYRRVWSEIHGYFSLSMVTTRGCPFHCNWCAKPIWGQSYAMRSPANVAEEMHLLKRQLRPDRLWFADDIFGLQPRWVEAFAAEVEARDAAIPFRIQSRVDLMTERAVEALARAGCHEVWLGVESGSQAVLDRMDKGTKVRDIPVARERLRGAGIRAAFFLQLGYPGETWEDLQATIELVRTTLPDEIGVSVSYPLPGTRFFERVQAQLSGKDHWDDSQDLAMLFQGTYRTPFYRRLHGLLHRDLALRRRQAVAPESVTTEEAANLAADWRELERLEPESRSTAPTAIEKTWPAPAAPDLSGAWGSGEEAS